MKKLFRFLTSRLFIFALCIAAQAAALILMISHLAKYGFYAYGAFTLMSLLTILIIVSKKDNPIYKLAWVIPVALFPILGWLLYFVAGRNHVSPNRVKRFKRVYEETKNLATQDEDIFEDLRVYHPSIARQVNYIKRTASMPIYKNTQTEYLSPGASFFKRLCEELEKAEKFIFMEYFIIEEGKMWNTVLDILARKAAQGVEVKMMYDDLGCIQTVPSFYFKKLRALGIEVHVFNVFTPSLDVFVNYRDHRKITVIDGNVGFTGGNNLADEYINEVNKYGYWQDSSIMLKGEAVWSLSVLFMQMWQYYQDEIMDYARYRPTKAFEGIGYIMPFGDGPLDNHLVGENVYINMLANAKEYVSITTPYLILDHEMITALCTTAQSGVRVSIITPENPDKWYVHMVTRYNYKTLLEAGVEIYEFKDGFIHSKTMVCDDEIAVVGTQNFDFRSFYLHYECAVLLYHATAVPQVRADHLACFVRSKKVTIEECNKRNVFIRMLQAVLNIFSPMM